MVSENDIIDAAIATLDKDPNLPLPPRHPPKCDECHRLLMSYNSRHMGRKSLGRQELFPRIISHLSKHKRFEWIADYITTSTPKGEVGKRVNVILKCLKKGAEGRA